MTRWPALTRWPARTVVPVALGLLVAALVFVGALNHAPGESAVLDWLPVTFALGFTPLGALVLAGSPRHPVGLLMTAAGVSASLTALSASWNEWVVLAWLDQWTWTLPIGLVLWALLLFPDGHLPSRRWRPLAVLIAAGTLVAGSALAVGALAAPRTLVTDVDDVLPPVARIVITIAGAAIAVVLLCAPVVIWSQVVRWRSAEPATRQQLACLLPAGALLLLGLILYAFGIPGAAVLAAVAVPAAMTLAVLRFRLYDLDQVINRTIVWLVMTVLVVVGFIALVTVLRTILMGDDDSSASLAATGIIVVAFEPLRRQVQIAVERLLYGDRDHPYRLITDLHQLGGRTSDPTALLPLLTSTIAQSLRVPYVAVELDEGGAEYGDPQAVTETFPMVSRGEEIGRLLVAPRTRGARFRPRERRLLADVALQAAAMAEARQLIRDLQDARDRLVRTREEERRGLRRDLHDGLGPALAGMSMQLHAARAEVTTPSRTGTILDAIAGDLSLCTTELQQLVSRLRPPALDRGLHEALDAECRRFTGSLTASLHVDGDLNGLPAAVEVAAFRIVAEAVTNVARHADATTCAVTVRRSDALSVEVVDDGRGIDPGAHRGIGLGSMRERAEELGGTFSATDRTPRGTTIQVELPVTSGARA